MKENKKGITLVALVITIIILLILAGITISQLTGSGLFENAKLAAEKSKNSQEKEEGILEDYENQMDQYLDNSRETVVVDKEEYEQLKSTVANINSGFQSDRGKMKITEAGTQVTFKSFTNLTPGLYFVTYSHALTIGGSGYIGIYNNQYLIANENTGKISGSSPIHSISAIIEITSPTDVISLRYNASETSTEADRMYSWQFIRLR